MNGINSINYSGVVFSRVESADLSAPVQVREHTLLYICSGEVDVHFAGAVTHLREGDCVFLRKDHRIVLDAWTPRDHAPFQSIALFFCRKFMHAYYKSVPRNQLPRQVKVPVAPVLKIEAGVALESLFLSLMPYLQAGSPLPEETAWEKRMEGLRIILHRDPGFYASLFDFTHPWKTDLMAFMEENYQYDLSQEELARYTGRSLSSFKRDFKKLSDLTPEKWILRRRLREAHRLLTEERRTVTDAMYESGFNNASFFSRAYKSMFGFPPSKTPVPQDRM